MSNSSATTSQTSGLSPDYASILQGFGGQAMGAMQLPYQNYQGPRVANLSPLQTSALSGYRGLLSGTPSMRGAEGMLTETLNGNGGNPFTEQVVNRATQGAKDQFNSSVGGIRRSFNSAGGWGSDRQNLALDREEQNLSRGLADATGSLYANAYESERGRQMQAASLAPTLANTYSGILGGALNAGDVQRRQDQTYIDANYGDWMRANDYPWTQLERGAGILGTAMGGAPRTTTTTGPGSDRVAQGVGLMQLANYFGSGSGGGKNSGGGSGFGGGS